MVAQAISPACIPGGECVANLSAAQLFSYADDLVGRGAFGAAEAVLRALLLDSNVQIRSEARFRLGGLFERQRRWSAAAQQYRAILDDDPGATAVRLELARVLALLGDEDAARRQLRRASSAGLPEDVARTVDRLQLGLRARRRVGGTVELDVAPDTNINHATNDTSVSIGDVPVDLSSDARAQPGIGTMIQSQAFWRPAVSADTNLLMTFSGSGTLYRKSRFDDVGMTASIGPELSTGRSRVTSTAVLSRRWFGGERYSDSYGGRINWLRPLDRTSQIQLSFSASHTDYKVNASLTGLSFGATVGYEQAFSPRFSGRASLQLIRTTARDPAFGSWAAGGEILLSRDFAHENVYARLGYYRTEGDARFFFPPAARRDDLIDLQAGVLLRSLALRAFAPVIRLHRTQNTSPIFFYSFRSTRVEFGVTHEF